MTFRGTGDSLTVSWIAPRGSSLATTIERVAGDQGFE